MYSVGKHSDLVLSIYTKVTVFYFFIHYVTTDTINNRSLFTENIINVQFACSFFYFFIHSAHFLGKEK